MFDELLSRALRSSPTYEVVVSDLLRPDEREAAARLAGRDDFYGILRPRPGPDPRPPRAIDSMTALLVLTLREPAPLPAFARRTLGAGAGEAVARWVADGVLEIEIDGAFLSGPRALERFAAPAGVAPASRIARLSRAALESAAALDSPEVERIALHLYAAGRLPCGRSEAERFPDGEAVLRHLFAASSEAQRLRFASSWRSSHRSGRWLHWRPAGPGGSEEPEPGAAAYKLYISPALEALPAVWSLVAEGLAAHGALELKVGANAAGLLRPDKMVSYFASPEALGTAAEALAAALAGVPAQGVPFTCEIAGAGLLSWGLDPGDPLPAGTGAGSWRGPRREGESWRHWLVRHLARLLAAARSEGESAEGAGRYALARIALAGVDPRTWAPAERLRRDLGALS